MSTKHAPMGIVGNFNADLVVGPVSHMPAWDEEVLADGCNLWTAGTAGYMALAAQALGMEPRIVSAIGDDQTGRSLLADLARRSIPTAGIALLPGERTPMGIVVVGPGGKRAILSFNGAHDRLDRAVYEGARASLAGCAELIICGTYLLPRLGPAEAAWIARGARQQGQLVIFDPSWDPAGWPAATRQATLALLSEVDIYMPNEPELLALTGAASWQEGLETVGRLCPEVVVKRGGEGAAALVAGQLTEVPALPVNVADTIGAGDSFDVGYLWARRQGWPVAQRLRFANALAGLVVASPDRSRFPGVDSVLARLA
ncbi:MAG TPA: sugar kinase [Symbiobacteriaceae bacterium]|nr:sugar kinase [Symbiobacteriaceae bacterium]